MKGTQFVIALDGSKYRPMYEHMLGDLLNCDDVTFVADIKKDSFIKKQLLKRKTRMMLKNKFDFLAYEENNLYKTIKYYYSHGKDVCVICLNASLFYNSYLPGTLIKYKKEWPSLKFVLFYLDIMNTSVSSCADTLRNSRVFDLVYSIDKNDVEKTGAVFRRTFNSKSERYDNIVISNDMYFCGVSKGRSPILVEIVNAAERNNTNISMDIVCYENFDVFRNHKSVNIRKPGCFMSYPEVLHKELEASCILEIVQEGQVAPTLRPYEAVVYNKKLLTNNKFILEFPYSDSNYMQYFEKVEDIDWEWVKEDIDVDYGYNGEFSPIHLLEDICKRMNGENQ